MKHLLVHNLLQARHSEKEDMISSMDNLQVIDYVSLVLMLNVMYVKLYDSKFKFCHILWRNKPIPERLLLLVSRLLSY